MLDNYWIVFTVNATDSCEPARPKLQIALVGPFCSMPCGIKLETIRLKLLDICYRFGVVSVENDGDSLLFELIIARVKTGLVSTDELPPPIDPADRQEVTKAYINQLVETPVPPTMELSHAFFTWIVDIQGAEQTGLAAAFFKTTFNRLWVAMEEMKNPGQAEYIRVDRGMLFTFEATRYFGSVRFLCSAQPTAGWT
ncbi:hypothetical protein FRC07_005502 [Ceratobasidium sp. 392]|nr:hypothetical protein FRC07_005502 [Ceratobasidium sp. 392]